MSSLTVEASAKTHATRRFLRVLLLSGARAGGGRRFAAGAGGAVPGATPAPRAQDARIPGQSACRRGTVDVRGGLDVENARRTPDSDFGTTDVTGTTSYAPGGRTSSGRAATFGEESGRVAHVPATAERVAAGRCHWPPSARRPPSARGVTAGATFSGVTPLVVIVVGLAAIAAGSLLLRTYGGRARVARLLAVTPDVTIAQARALALAGDRRYIRIEGRVDADEEFEDENARPLVFRRRRIEARLAGGGWRTIDEQRQAVTFRLREGLDEIGIDDDAIDQGLVTLVRESTGTAGEAPDLLPRPLPAATPVRVRIEQLSSVEHLEALGVPVADTVGAVRLCAGTGRPLIVSSLERADAMRVLAEGRRSRPIAAAAALLGGMALLVVGFGWALIAGIPA